MDLFRRRSGARAADHRARQPAERTEPAAEHWMLRLQRQIGNALTSNLVRAAALRAEGGGLSTTVPVQREKDEFRMPTLSPGELALGMDQRTGSKTLSSGTMAWSLMITPAGLASSDEFTGDASAIIQIVFTPKPGRSSSGTITFLQTVSAAKLGKTGTAGIDAKPNEFDPFYGPRWNENALDWVPEMAVPKHRANRSSTAADPSAYLYDAPSAPPGVAKRFESVAVDTRSGATLGALSWGVGGGRLIGGTVADCYERPSGDFGAAVESFYATPTSGTPVDPGPRFEAILDEYRAGDAALSDAHRTELDRVAAKVTSVVKERRKVNVLMSGHGDAMDSDPMGASRRRVDAAVDYLIKAGVPKGVITSTGIGDKWARAVVSMKEGRNRRVQVKLTYPD